MQAATIATLRPCRTDAVERISGLSQRDFHKRFAVPRVPVVLLDAMDQWACSEWSPEFFARRFGERKVVVAYGPGWRKMPVGSLIKAVLQSPGIGSSRVHSSFTLYLRNRHIGEDFPELMDDFAVAKYFSSNWLQHWPLKSSLPFSTKASIEIFIGPPGARGPNIHRDSHMTHAWISQIYGTKKVWMVSPTHDNCMYPDPANRFWSLLNDFERPDLERFPLFAQAELISTVLSPGETVFIPAGWWHTAECATPSISLSGNFADRSNFRDFRKTMVLRRFSHPGRIMRACNRSSLYLHGLLCQARRL